MAVIIPQVVTSDRASGAQVIDGSLKFDSGKEQYLQRTFGSGDRKTYTYSTDQSIIVKNRLNLVIGMVLF